MHAVCKSSAIDVHVVSALKASMSRNQTVQAKHNRLRHSIVLVMSWDSFSGNANPHHVAIAQLSMLKRAATGQQNKL